MITIYCYTCRRSQSYDNHSPPNNPDHKCRLLIYEEPDSRDYYFCNLQCLSQWINSMSSKQLKPSMIDVEDLVPIKAKKTRKRKLLLKDTL